MARVRIAAMPWGVLQDRHGNAQQLEEPTLTDLEGGAVTVYADSSGDTTVPLVSNSRGELPGWVEAGTYLLDTGRGPSQVEAPSGSVESFVDETSFADGEQAVWDNALGKLIGAAPTAFPIVSVKAAPYNATGDGTTNDRAAVQAAIDAVNTLGGGVVFFPRGTYKCLTGITCGDKVSLVGESRWASIISFPSDLGTGNFAIGVSNAQAQRFPSIRDLSITGLARPTSPAAGVTPANMYGVQALNGWMIERCYISGFKAGIAWNGNHIRFVDVYSTNNYYGAYLYGSAGSLGDIVFDRVQLDGNTMASLAVGKDNVCVGATFKDGHMGFGPYCIYKETGGSNANLIQQCTFLRHPFESWAHAIIKGQTDGVHCRMITMVGCDMASAFDAAADYQIAGATEKACIDLGTGLLGLHCYGGVHPIGGVGTEGVIRATCEDVYIERLEYNGAVDAAHTAGLPYIVGGSGQRFRGRIAGNEVRAIYATGAVSKYDLIERTFSDNAQRAQSGFPFGVSLQTIGANNNVLAYTSGEVEVNDGGVIASNNKALYPDSANAGRVREYVPASDNAAKIVGYSTNGTVSSRCRAHLRLA